MERDRESRIKQAEELTSLWEHVPAPCTGYLTLLEHQNAGPALQHHSGTPQPWRERSPHRPHGPPYRAGSRSTHQPLDCWQSLLQSFSSLPAFPPKHESRQKRNPLHWRSAQRFMLCVVPSRRCQVPYWASATCVI